MFISEHPDIWSYTCGPLFKNQTGTYVVSVICKLHASSAGTSDDAARPKATYYDVDRRRSRSVAGLVYGSTLAGVCIAPHPVRLVIAMSRPAGLQFAISYTWWYLERHEA